MKNRKIKDRCEKNHFSKCPEVCKTYDAIQTAYAKELEDREDISEFRCNVPFEAKEGDELDRYTSDIACTKDYWFERGVTDWGIVVDEEK